MTLNSLIPIVWQNLIFTGRDDAHHNANALSEGSVLTIRRGAYLNRDIIANSPSAWTRSDIISLSRTLSCLALRPSMIATCHTATLLYAIPRISPHDSFHFASGSLTGGQLTLPPVLIDGVVIAPTARVHIHRGSRIVPSKPGSAPGPRPGRVNPWMEGTQTLSLTRPQSHPPTQLSSLAFLKLPHALVSKCLEGPAEDAFITACMGLHHMSGRRSIRSPTDRALVLAAQEQLIVLLEALPPHTRGALMAKDVITLADGACKSVAEAKLLWILLSHGVQEISTQHRVVVNGRTYFVDCALPAVKIAIEFDGRTKRGSTPHDQDRADYEMALRQRDLEAAGWTVIRLKWEDLFRPEAVAAQVINRAAHLNRRLAINERQASRLAALQRAD